MDIDTPSPLPQRVPAGRSMVLGLFGAGGCARSLMPVALGCAAAYARANPGIAVRTCFVDLNPRQSELNGVPLISQTEFFALDCDQRFFNVAIAESRLRERIVNECLQHGVVPMSLQSHSAEVFDYSHVAEGAVLCGNTMVTANVTIGRYFHANIFSYVEHDCVIGDYVTFAPAVRCNGNVHIGDHAYIGTGAVIKQGAPGKPLRIGTGAVVGMGAVVTKDVAPGVTVVGNPARPIQSR